MTSLAVPAETESLWGRICIAAVLTFIRFLIVGNWDHRLVLIKVSPSLVIGLTQIGVSSGLSLRLFCLPVSVQVGINYGRSCASWVVVTGTYAGW